MLHAIAVTLLVTVSNIAQGWSCPWSLCSSGLTSSKCNNASDTAMDGACCVLNTSIIGIDLTNCTFSSMPADFFTSKLTNASDLLWLSLSSSALNKSNFNIDSLRSLINLDHLDLLSAPFKEICPPFSGAWNMTKLVDDMTLSCDQQNNQCKNYTCFAKSQCLNDGPGMVSCICSDSYFGYKCLRRGHFPYILFFCVLGSSTIALAAGLWFTQRRYIKSKTN